MSKYRTAQGKIIDMGALIAKNEKTRAVGNMKVNARGDTIDAYGRIIKPVTEKVNENYAKTVGNRTAQTRSSPRAGNEPLPEKQVRPTAPQPVKSDPNLEELSDFEREFHDTSEEDMEIEKIKAKDQGKK